jgi:hypothetical protein
MTILSPFTASGTRENIHDRMARVPALGVPLIRRKRVGRGAIEKLGTSPSAAVQEFPAILLDELYLVQGYPARSRK